MCKRFTDGSVLLSKEEMEQLNLFAAKVEALSWQHKTLVAIHNHLLIVHDAFVTENEKLKEQLVSDQQFQILQIDEARETIINLL